MFLFNKQWRLILDWQDNLVSLYLDLCKAYEQRLQHYIWRDSHHCDLCFSDEEVLTIYIWGIMQRRSEIKEIHEYAHRHLRDWFPHLPTYYGFVHRLNTIAPLFQPLTDYIFKEFPGKCHRRELARLIDSMPIIMAQNGRRFKARVAREIATDNGYCATKKLHYYGVKLHVMAAYEQGSLPVPEYFGITGAGTADIRAYEQIAEILPEGTKVFADKAYQNQGKPVHEKENHTLYTPVKKQKGQERLHSADKLLSTAISSVRQPIEALFSWIEEKTKIQFASKVRSYQGLMVHIFGKLAAAFLLLKNRKLCS